MRFPDGELIPFHARLAIVMATYGVRPVEVCERLGMDQAQLSKILSAQHEPRPETRKRILLAVQAADFATDTPRRSARTSQTATR